MSPQVLEEIVLQSNAFSLTVIAGPWPPSKHRFQKQNLVWSYLRCHWEIPKHKIAVFVEVPGILSTYVSPLQF